MVDLTKPRHALQLEWRICSRAAGALDVVVGATFALSVAECGNLLICYAKQESGWCPKKLVRRKGEHWSPLLARNCTPKLALRGSATSLPIEIGEQNTNADRNLVRSRISSTRFDQHPRAKGTKSSN